MAKRPISTARKAPRRTARALPKDLVQPGAVGMQLSSAIVGGAPMADDIEADDQGSDAHEAELRRSFLAKARSEFRMSADAESELRRDMLADMRFYNSEQWPEAIAGGRLLDNMVTLTINRLPQFVRQVVNQARQSKPAIQVNPVDNNADPDTAEVLQGICRQIERQSKAHIAYSTASEHQAIMGRGWWRIVADYARDDSMEQEIRIKRILDSFTVYGDPSCQEPDNSDATFTFVVERLNKTVYNATYPPRPGEDAVSLTSFQSIGDDAPTWMNGDGVQVAEYFYIEHTRQRLAEVLFTATTAGPVRVTVPRDTITAAQLVPTSTTTTPAVVILKERWTVRKQVKWALINGVDILDGNADRTAGRDLPGTYIPVVPVLGEELVVNGRRNLRGMVRDAQSPQRAYNFWISGITQKLALSTKAPVIAATGQLEGHETKWNQANIRNYPYLEYNAIEVNGSLVPAPQRASYDPDISAALQMTMQADRDLKSVIGMFDASQEHSREQSGKAILARQKQGEDGTSHFLDNLSRSIEHTGRILLEWIPVYYDAPRMLRILGLDDQPRNVIVHVGQDAAAQAMGAHPKADQALVDVIKQGRVFDLGLGRYDAAISVGPSYQTRRQESVESLIQLIQAYPALLPVIGDVLMENMDWPGARVLAARLKRMVPPQAKDPEDGQPEIPPEVQQQMQQLDLHLKAAMAAVQEKDQIIQTKAQELASKGQIAKMEIDSKERLEQLKAKNDLLMLQMQIKSDHAMALLEARLKEIQQRLDHAHADKPAQPVVHPSESINYKDAPPDIRRQMEEAAGMTPSTAKEESPNAPPPPKPMAPGKKTPAPADA